MADARSQVIIPAPPKTTSPPAGAHGPAASGARSTILVVDDEARNRNLVCGYLGPFYEMREASDAASAVQALDSGPVDLVLLDVMMPGVSGFEVCRQIKSRPSAEFLPVLLLTALGEQEDRNAGLEAGADDFLTKPVDRRELVLRVRTFLRIREQQTLIRRQVDTLQELGALKDDLVSLLVHDLRNPLASVVGILHVVREDADPSNEELRQDLELALQSTTRLRDILEDILQVRMLEEGRLVLNRQPVSLRTVAEEALVSVMGMARDHEVLVTTAAVPDAVAPLDPKLVRRALENLLVNAIKYSPSGGTVELSWAPADGGLEISIADRGDGIPAPVRETLCQKFGNVSLQKRSERRGYGLGLYQVRLAVDAHGGSVRASDREGGGTVFAVFLPTVPAEPPT
jgi:two-component system sensor histidine kinase/response regulator